MDAEIFEFSSWVSETSPDILKKKLNQILTQCDFSILNFIDHTFKPQGYTALWLLCESHLSVHTFPEKNKTYIQLSSCSHTKYTMFIQLLHDLTIT